MGGLFFRETPPANYRDWKRSDYTFYDTLAQHLIDEGVHVRARLARALVHLGQPRRRLPGEAPWRSSRRASTRP